MSIRDVLRVVVGTAAASVAGCADDTKSTYALVLDVPVKELNQRFCYYANDEQIGRL